VCRRNDGPRHASSRDVGAKRLDTNGGTGCHLRIGSGVGQGRLAMSLALFGKQAYYTCLAGSIMRPAYVTGIGFDRDNHCTTGGVF
jgi:hypothetical protein